MTDFRRELALAMPPALLATALVVAGAASARFARDAGAGAETVALALWGAAVLAPLGWAAARAPARAVAAPFTVAGAALAVALSAALLPRAGALRGAVVAAALVAACLVVVRAVARARRVSPAALAATSFAVSLVAHGHRLWTAPFAAGSLLLLVALPAVATAAAGMTTRRAGGVRGAIAGGTLLLAPLVAREPWPILLALATLLAIALTDVRLARPGRAALAGAAALALLAGAFPWLRPAPLSTLLGAIVDRPRPTSELSIRVLNLTASRPTIELTLDGSPITALRLDSYLTNSTALPCGTALAAITLSGGGERYRAELLVGRDSAEWAADRPDVARALVCAPPAPWAHFVPAAGRFLGRLSRATLRPPRPVDGEALRLERAAGLPADLTLSLFELAAER